MALLASGCMGVLETEGARDVPLAPDDGVDPIVRLDEPAAGSIVSGTSVHFAGTVEDEQPSHVLIGTTRLVVGPNGRFSGDIELAPGAHRVHVVGVDASGREGSAVTTVLLGELAAAGTVVTDAVAFEVSSEALAEVGRGVGAMLTARSFSDELRAENPIYESSVVDVEVQGEAHGEVQVTLVPSDGALAATVTIASLVVDLDADVPIFGGVDVDVTASAVQVMATIALGATGGRAEGSVLSSDVTISGFGIDIEHVPGAIELLVRDSLASAAERALDRAVADALPGLVASALATVSDGAVFDVNGAEIALAATVGELQLDPSGARARADLGIEAVAPRPGREGYGHLLVPHGPLPIHSAPLAIDVAIEALDAALAALWAGGAMDLALDAEQAGAAFDAPLTLRQLGIFLPGIGRGLPLDTPVSVTIEPLLPPVITPTDAGALRIEIVDLHVTLSTDTGDLVTLSVGASIEATARAVLGRLAIDLGAMEVDVDFVGAPPAGASADLLTALLQDILDGSARDLVPPDIGIPSLAGFDIVPSSIAVRDGYLSLEAAVAPTGAP